MNIGFIENHLSIRGTSLALFEYAHFNEKLLNNNSFIITRKYKTCNDIDETLEIHEKFSNRFNNRLIYYTNKNDIQKTIDDNKLSIVYIIKGGNKDELTDYKNCKTIIHCVFNTKQKHGDFYCGISSFLNLINNTNIPVLPHMISLTKEYIQQFTNEQNINVDANLKNELNIPQDAYVIGRYGGLNQFNIPFAYNVINKLSNEKNNLYFLFMNTQKFNCNNNKVLFINGTTDMYYKLKFVNTCNALLHARSDGETFGLTVGEFAVNDKQIITFDSDNMNYAKNHLMILKDKCHKFKTENELEKILIELPNKEIDMTNNDYKKFSPENVMKIFSVILNQL
jgi:hypothetical protein